jgi:hypothetical protein
MAPSAGCLAVACSPPCSTRHANRPISSTTPSAVPSPKRALSHQSPSLLLRASVHSMLLPHTSPIPSLRLFHPVLHSLHIPRYLECATNLPFQVLSPWHIPATRIPPAILDGRTPRSTPLTRARSCVDQGGLPFHEEKPVNSPSPGISSLRHHLLAIFYLDSPPPTRPSWQP